MMYILASGYIFITSIVLGYTYMDRFDDITDCWRYAIFWPIYAIHWFIRNIILAIKGL
jgi:hypothetical protein